MSKKLFLPVAVALSILIGAAPSSASPRGVPLGTLQTESARQLPAPSGLRVTRIEPRLVVLNWEAVPGAQGYKVSQFREIDGLVREVTFINITGTWRVESLLLPETDYRFEVVALGAAGVDSEPASIEATTAPLPVFKPVIGLNTVSDSSVGITWFQRPQVEAYDIYRDGDFVERTPGPFSGYTDNTVEAETTYRYQVAEVIGDRSSPLSDELVVRTLPAGAFDNPPPVEVTFEDRSRVVLRVGPVSPQQRGQTEVQITGGNLGTLTVPVPPRGQYPYVWLTDRDLAPGTTYSYEVGYVEADGTVPSTTTVQATTEAVDLTVEGLTVTFTDRSRVVLRMDNPAGMSGDIAFVIERDGEVIATTTADRGSRTWFTDRDLEAGSTVTYRVALEVGGQRGALSDEVTVTLSS